MPSLAQTPAPTPEPAPPVSGPVATLEGPTVLKVGNTARITNKGSLGKNFIWKIWPKEAETDITIYPLAVTDPATTPTYLVLFESDKPGKYLITLVVTENNQSDIAQLELTNGDGVPTPNPGPGPNPNPTPVVVPNVPTPVVYLQNIVNPIKMTGQDVKKDAAELANFYNDMADVIERDTATNKISTTGAIRELNVNAGTLMFNQTGMKDKYAGLGEAVDSALVQVLTLEDTALSVTKRQDCINVFRALAWRFIEIYKQN